MKAKNPNRVNARKRKGAKNSCALCKPYKHKWEHRFSTKERVKRKVRE